MISTVQKYGGNMKINVNKPEELIIDIVEWDIRNWWRAIEYWEETHQFDDVKGKGVLDIGGRGGGLSLYWALKGAAVICSDVNENGFVKVVDIAEIAEALEKEILSVELAKKALYRLDALLCMIYDGTWKQKTEKYFEMGLK